VKAPTILQTQVSNSSSFHLFTAKESESWMSKEEPINRSQEDKQVEQRTIQSIICSDVDNGFAKLNRTRHDRCAIIRLCAARLETTAVNPLQ
jgi:hypothetical protein